MPSRINTAEPTAALIQAFRLQGDFRPQMDEMVSPVVVIGRLDGGPAADWPRNLSADWRGSARSINVSTNPAIWWRFLAPAGHDKAARITRLQLTSMSGAALFAIFRGDLEPVLGGVQGAILPGTWLDDLAPNPNAFTPPANSVFGLAPMTGGANVTFSGNPAALIRVPSTGWYDLDNLGIDCPPGGVVSIVPLLAATPGTSQQWRHEGVVSSAGVTVEWLEQY